MPNPLPGAERARWLAELSEALDGARQLLVMLELNAEQRRVAHELFLRIEAARLEVHSLRLARSAPAEIHFSPEWSQSSPWAEYDAR